MKMFCEIPLAIEGHPHVMSWSTVPPLRDLSFQASPSLNVISNRLFLERALSYKSSPTDVPFYVKMSQTMIHDRTPKAVNAKFQQVHSYFKRLSKQFMSRKTGATKLNNFLNGQLNWAPNKRRLNVSDPCDQADASYSSVQDSSGCLSECDDSISTQVNGHVGSVMPESNINIVSKSNVVEIHETESGAMFSNVSEVSEADFDSRCGNKEVPVAAKDKETLQSLYDRREAIKAHTGNDENKIVQAELPVVPESPKIATSLRTVEVQCSSSSPRIRSGKRYIPRYLHLQNQNNKVRKSLYRSKLENARLQNQNKSLSKMVGLKTRNLLKEKGNVLQENEKLKKKVTALKSVSKSMIKRSQHEEIKKKYEKENKDLRKQNLQVQIERDNISDENERLKRRLAEARQKRDSYRKQVSNREEKINKLLDQATKARNEYRIDKDATDMYYAAIVEQLRLEVAEGKKSSMEMQNQIKDLQSLETKVNGVYKPQVRLLWYDLLLKGVSANIIQSVVSSVIEKLTGIETSDLHLPSRSSAQRMVLEAGELAKIRTVMELSKNDGNAAHQSDGTTKSLVHWGTHILRLNVNDKNQRFTLGVLPVLSGKACDTIETLQEHFQELRDLADLMNIQYNDNTFSVSRVSSRMSDGAANELSVGKMLVEEKRKLCEQSDDWNTLSEGEKNERVRVCVFTCGSHKVDNMATAMTTAAMKYFDRDLKGRSLKGAKKLIYEVNKLACEQGRKEYGKGKEIKMFALDQGSSRDVGNLQPIVGNRYIIYLLNAVPTLLSKDLIVAYLKQLKELKALNKLEESVLEGYEDQDIEVELCGYALMYFYICEPLLMKAKAVKSPLQMNQYYQTVVLKLGEIMDDPSMTIDSDIIMWPGAIKMTHPFYEMVQKVKEIASKRKPVTYGLLAVMAKAGKEKLSKQAKDHLIGGAYENPTPQEEAAAALIDAGNNDIVESCFGDLDRQQTLCPVRNPINTSALITGKKDKVVDYVSSQTETDRENMIIVARKSAGLLRKKRGTTLDQEKKMWEAKKLEENKQRTALKERHAKKRKATAALASDIAEGKLKRNPGEISNVKGIELNHQFKLWMQLKADNYDVLRPDLLKGYSTLRVSAKRERLVELITTNQSLIIEKHAGLDESDISDDVDTSDDDL